MQPALALGQIVHKVIESLSVLPVEKRFEKSLLDLYEFFWKDVSGDLGGFHSTENEESVKEQGRKMLGRVKDYPGPLLQKAIKIRQDLPYFWLSEEENIILCGKIDWLEYHEEENSVKIIDFKTGKYDEDPNSLQLPIYHLLVKNCQTKNIKGAAYWYLNRDNVPLNIDLPSLDESLKRVSDIANHIALARKFERLLCKRKGGCISCNQYEAIIAGKGKFVGVNDYRQDIYIL